ncbi:DUF1858 domain-containing protein [Azospirillum sp. A1-3]|uniref:DUF1858 domain-containing protein n=1 Tax=Azospirillum sp. A1-3 TaxID=185874 RepID=UPI0020778A77|nr:DUF1858 domain-containing protein [Azospirillum sp. A1-3]MCM8737499.1 DUF1858 domain-containing protein [Azospirillum sp. A1-3]
MTVADMAFADMKLADLTMAELMSARPAVVPVLLRHGLACPGCAMAPFMTVREAAEAYGLELDAFLADLAAADGRPGHSIEAHSTEIR